MNSVDQCPCQPVAPTAPRATINSPYHRQWCGPQIMARTKRSDSPRGRRPAPYCGTHCGQWCKSKRRSTPQWSEPRCVVCATSGGSSHRFVCTTGSGSSQHAWCAPQCGLHHGVVCTTAWPAPQRGLHHSLVHTILRSHRFLSSLGTSPIL